MKGIYLVVILYVATLSVALDVSPVTDFPTECPTNIKPWNKTIFIPHENDCTKFYNCYMGKKGKPLDCPFRDNDGNRLHFNSVLQVCDWPWNARCQLSSTRSISTPTRLTNGTISPSSSLTSLTSSSNTSSTLPPSSPTSPTSSSNPPTTTTLSPSSSTSSASSSSDLSTTSTSSSPTSPTSSSNPSTTTTTLQPSSSTSPASPSSDPPTTSTSSSSPTSPTSSSNPPTTTTLSPSSSTSSASSSSDPPTTSTSSYPTSPTSSNPSTTTTLQPSSSTSPASPSSDPPTTSTSSSSPTSPTSSSNPPTTTTLQPSSSTSPASPSSDPPTTTTSSSSPTSPTSSSNPPTTTTLSPSSSTSSASSSSDPPTTSTSSYPTSPTSSNPSTTTTLQPSSSTSPASPSSDPPTTSTSSSSPTSPTSSSNPPTTTTLQPSSSTSPASPSSDPPTTTTSSSSPTSPTSSSNPPTTTTLSPSSSTSSASSSSDPPTTSTSSYPTSPTSSNPSTTTTLQPSSSTSPASPSSDPPTTSTSSSSPTSPTSSSNPPTTTTLQPSSSTSPASPSSDPPTTTTSSSSPTSPTSSSNPPTTTTLSPSSSTSPASSSSDPPTTSTSSSSPTSPTSSSNPSTTTTLQPSSSTLSASPSSDPSTTSTSSSSPTLPTSSSNPSTTTTLQPSSSISSTPPASSPTPSNTTKNTTVTSPLWTCELDDRNHMIPHETMCDHYYTCFNGKINPKPKKCDRNLLFNPILRVCDYPDNVNCNHTPNTVRSTIITTPAISSSTVITTTPSTSPLPSPSPTTITTPASTTITTAIPATTTQAFEKPRQKCPSKESTEVARIADHCLCNIYYECVNGVKMQQTCPTGMHFDYVREICDWPETVNCVRPISIVGVLIGSCQSNKCYPEGRAFQHEIDCSSYYLCSEGKKILKHCTAGLHFNVTLQICDYPAKTGCNLTAKKFLLKNLTAKKFPKITQSTCPPPGSTKKVLLPHQCSCKQYYECVKGSMRLRECPKDLHFDSIKKTCTHPDEANCPYVCPCPNSSEKVLLPHECKCDQYYECVKGKQCHRFCPIGFHFDYIEKICKHADDANCATPPDSTTTSTTKRSTTTDTTTTSTTVTTTTEAPDDKPRKKCPPKGSTEVARIAHHCLCNIYYECVNGVKMQQTCPTGMHFDYVREICDWPETVNCVRPISIVGVLIGSCQSNKCYPEGRAFQHEIDCSSYYLCSEGKKILKHCTAELHFNVTLQICDYPAKTGCNLTAKKFLLKNLTAKKFPKITQSTCPPPGSTKKVLLPHECSCKQYYECVNGRMRPRNCPKDLHFDSIKKTCTHPDEANCPYVCPCPNSSEKLLPHECKCDQYYECVKGKQRQRFCPIGFHFDYIEKICKHADDANCATPPDSTTTSTTKRSTTTDTTTTSTTKRSTITDTTTTSTTVTTTTEAPDDKPRKKCPPKGSTEKAQIAHPFVCNIYYECVNGEKILKTCPIGKHFDYVREVCDWAFVVNCVRPIPTYDIFLIDNCDNECSQEGRAFRHEIDCSSYYLCSNGKKILKQCIAGLHFNVTLQICDYPYKPSCDLPDNSLSIFTSNDCPLDSTENVYMPHKCKCTHYYECINGRKILHECPDGLHFDKIRQSCNDPIEAGCDPILKSTPTSTISTTTWLEETDKTTINDRDPATCIGTCPEVDPPRALLLPNEDCKKFCMCSNGIAWVQYCPEPLYFDSKDTVCKNKRDAICGKRSFNQDSASMLHRMIDDENSLQPLNKENNDLDPATCIGTCPEKDPEFAVLLPNEDCKKFCLCSNGIAWVQPCPEPLYFDSKDKVCKNKRDAVCGKRSFNQDSTSMLHRMVDDENLMQPLNKENYNEQKIYDNSWSKIHSYNPSPFLKYTPIEKKMFETSKST